MVEYSQEIADAICDRIGQGNSLRAICAVEGMPTKSLFLKWVANNEQLCDQYTRAREAQAEGFADELIEIADDDSGDVSGELQMPNAVAVQRSKLKYEARKWVVSKLLAKKYGDSLKHTGADGEGPVQFVVTRSGSKEK